MNCVPALGKHAFHAEVEVTHLNTNKRWVYMRFLCVFLGFGYGTIIIFHKTKLKVKNYSD